MCSCRGGSIGSTHALHLLDLELPERWGIWGLGVDATQAPCPRPQLPPTCSNTPVTHSHCLLAPAETKGSQKGANGSAEPSPRPSNGRLKTVRSGTALDVEAQKPERITALPFKPMTMTFKDVRWAQQPPFCCRRLHDLRPGNQDQLTCRLCRGHTTLCVLAAEEEVASTGTQGLCCFHPSPHPFIHPSPRPFIHPTPPLQVLGSLPQGRDARRQQHRRGPPRQPAHPAQGHQVGCWGGAQGLEACVAATAAAAAAGERCNGSPRLATMCAQCLQGFKHTVPVHLSSCCHFSPTCSGSFRPGILTALMGASGAGKVRR